MRRWNEGEVLAAVFVLLLCLAAGWFCFVHLPLVRARTAAQQDAEEAHRVQVETANFANGHADWQAALADQQQRRGFLVQALPLTLAQGTFLSHLERQAIARHLVLSGVVPAPAEMGADGVGELVVRVRLVGDYFSLVDFLQDIASLRIGGRFVEVRGIRVRSDRDGAPLTCELTLAIFALGEQGK